VIAIEVRGLERVVGKLQRAAAEATASTERSVRLASILARRKLVERMSVRGVPIDPFWGKGSPAGAYLGARTGQTRARLSPGGVVLRLGNVFRAAVGSPDAHVKLHEEGGTARGSSPRGFLRIPTAAAQSASGAEQQRFAGKSLRQVAGLFLVRTLGGRLWIAEQQGRRGVARGSSETQGRGRSRIVLLFMLKKTATHRPRGLFAAVRGEMERELVGLARLEVTGIAARANA